MKGTTKKKTRFLSPFAENRGRKSGDEREEISASEGFHSRQSAGKRYPRHKPTGTSSKNKTVLILIGLVILILFNRFYDVKIVKKSGSPQSNYLDWESELGDLSSDDIESAQSYIKFKKIKASFIPSGTPEVYGQELDISFDEVQDAINKVQVYGPTYGEEDKKITLTGADMERYKTIGESIACEYCCGVKTLTKEDGSAACGCAHSIMMRGLAAYLIKNHPDEFTDDEILEELAKWKITYFPKQTLSTKLTEMEKAGESGIKELLEEFPDFLPQMVGGC